MDPPDDCSCDYDWVDCVDCCRILCDLPAFCLPVILVGVVLTAVLAACYGWIRHPKVTIDGASLTRFNLTTSPVKALQYNLSLTLSYRNPNFAMGIRFLDVADADYYYAGALFDRIRLQAAGYRLNRGETDVYHLSSGSDAAYAALGNAGVNQFAEEKAAGGMFSVEVRLPAKVRYDGHFTRCDLSISCPMRLQLVPVGSPEPPAFRPVHCRVDLPAWGSRGC